MNYDKIGNFIAEKRKLKGLTQKELAKKIGVTDKAVSKWERGLGCPDVSILEVLSKELDVSILELLKGREILDEVIPVTELNDYVKDTIKYSKDSFFIKVKKYLSYMLLGIVLFISIILVSLNIIHYNYLNRNYAFYNKNNVSESNTEYNNYIDNYLDKTKVNIDKIISNKGKYKDEDYKKIVMYISNSYNYLREKKANNLYSSQSIKIKDVYNLYLTTYDVILQNYNVYHILSSYDSSINTLYYMYNYMTTVSLKSISVTEIHNSYKYNYSVSRNDYIGNDVNKSYIINLLSSEMYANGTDIINLYDLTNKIIEVGDINE